MSEEGTDTGKVEEPQKSLRQQVEDKEIAAPREDVPPEVALGSAEAPPARTALDPSSGKYEPKMYRRDEEHPSHGTIHIICFPHKEFDIKFEGDIRGPDISRAYRIMRRGYRLWMASKSKTMKQVTAEAEEKKLEVHK